MDKSALSERDICTKFITPAIEASGRDRATQFLEEVNLTIGRVVVRGNKANRDEKTIRRADYVLYYKPGIPIAVVEAKDNKHSVRDGIQQGLDVSASKMATFLFPLPPRNEQSRIVDRVTELRVLCASLRQRLFSVQQTQFRLAEALVESVVA